MDGRQRSPNELYPYHQQAFRFSSPPPEEPKDESDQLAVALALSQSESQQQQRLLEQEEADLARALAESMLPTTSSFLPLNDKIELSPLLLPTSLPALALEPDDTQETPLASTPHSIPDPHAFGLGRYNKWQVPDGPVASSSKQIDYFSNIGANSDLHEKSPAPRRQSVSSVSSLPYTKSNDWDNVDSDNTLPQYGDGRDDPPPEPQQSHLASLTSIQQTDDDESKLVFDDEAYARQLAEEEEEELRLHIERKGNLDAQRRSPSPDRLPLYAAADQPPHSFSTSPPPTLPRVASSLSLQSRSSRQSGPSVERVESAYTTSSSSSHDTSPPAIHPESRYPTQLQSHLGLRTVSSSISIPQSVQSLPVQPLRRESNLESTDRPHSFTGSHNNNTYSSGSHGASTPQSVPAATNAMLNANHFIDKDLLVGVTIGFFPPAISLKMAPMTDAMPNIISLPHSRCPPLHLQAPDWRHLLRLMARLSGTRIEPTVEAMAVSKNEHKLRTVIQFIKRIGIYMADSSLVFTRSPPTPKFTASRNVFLEQSQSLTMVIRSNPHPDAVARRLRYSPFQNIYDPFSDSVPLPTLPITFPNLALYLQAALEWSRKHSSDTPGTLGKLGKMVQVCYPNVKEEDDDFDMAGRSGGMSHLFKRVIGRSSRDKKKGKGSSNNEETYQLVTPFVPDGWG